MDQIQGMRAFVAAVEEGSLTAAGRKLGLSPALTSKYVAGLEARLGVRLLNRTTRALHLTDEGEAYYGRASAILADVDELEEAVTARQSRPRGVLRVAGPRAFGTDRLAGSVARFMAAYPEVVVELDLHERMVDIVAEGYDLAVRIGELADSSFIARRIAPYPYYMCASPAYLEARGYPKTPDDLKGHDCIVTTALSPDGQWRFKMDGAIVSRPVRVRARTNTARSTAEFVRAGLGIGVCLSSTVEDDLAAGRLEVVLGDYSAYERSVFAVYPTSRHLSARVRAFVDFLLEDFKAQR